MVYDVKIKITDNIDLVPSSIMLANVDIELSSRMSREFVLRKAIQEVIYDYDYIILNPLKAKKKMDLGLRYNKTDKTDAYHLALIQRLYQ